MKAQEQTSSHSIYFACVTLALLTTDYSLVLERYDRLLPHILVFTFGLLALFLGARASIGPKFNFFQMWPNHGVKYWLKGSILFFGLAYALQLFLGASNPSDSEWARFEGLVYYPFLEEGIYRFLLCSCLIRIFGSYSPRSRLYTIIGSGLAFSLLHLFYGTIGLANILGGFLLAWLFVESRALWISILWHSVGNALLMLY